MGVPKDTVRRSTIQTLRNRYHATWSREWPFEDEYIAELWREVQDRNAKGNSRVALSKRYDDCLMLMRECHSFEPQGGSAPDQ